MKNPIVPALLGLMVILTAASWYKVSTLHSTQDATYRQYIEQAEKYEEKKIYIDAIDQYKKALELAPGQNELRYKIADLYQLLEEPKNRYIALRKAVENNENDVEGWKEIITYEIDNEQYRTAVQDITQELDKQQDGEYADWLKEQRLSLRSLVSSKRPLRYIRMSAYILSTDEKNGYAVYTVADDETQWKEYTGLTTLSDASLITPQYDQCGIYAEGYFPAMQEGELFYADSDTYRRKVPDGNVVYLGGFSEGFAPYIGESDAGAEPKTDRLPELISVINTKESIENMAFGYLDKDMRSYHTEYDFAGMFCNQVAPVCKDEKWFLIDTEFNPAGGEICEDIMLDEGGYATRYDVFWGKSGGLWYLHDLSGNRIGEQGFRHVKPFAGREPCAVEFENGKWGFVSIDGETVTEGKYSDACSYCGGYAAVKEEDGYSIIDADGDVLNEMENAFSSVIRFYPDHSFLAVDVKDDTLTHYTMMSLE